VTDRVSKFLNQVKFNRSHFHLWCSAVQCWLCDTSWFM